MAIEREVLEFIIVPPFEQREAVGAAKERLADYLGRKFPEPLPLMVSLQQYPGYRRMVGENWMHWHDYHEFFVALSGKGDFRSGNDRFQFQPGDVVLVDPLKIHGVLRMEREHAPLVVLFPAEAVAPGGAPIDLGFLAAWDRRPDLLVPRLEGSSPAAGAVHRSVLGLARCWFESAPGGARPQMLKLQLLDLLLQLRRAFIDCDARIPEERTARAEREARLGRVLEHVAQHFHGRVSQPEVARVAGMSISRFRVFFKETTGWGFADYLRELRLERAARLLRESAGSVAEVAYQTGFSDQSHLQRLFKARYAICPLAYRKQHRE